jgi:GntR family transcriptional regulator
MILDLTISAGSSSPIFRQIVDHMRLGAAMGRLSAGEQLPSVRTLAEKLLVNPNTVAKAYNELVRDGVVDAQQGRGFFIASPRQIYTKPERLRRIGPLIDALLSEALALGFSGPEIIEALDQKLSRFGSQTSQGRKLS